MTEGDAWNGLRPLLAGLGLDPRRVENIVGPGHPDVNYAGGDIELKWLADWPVRPDTPVNLPKFSGEQAGWLAQRWRHQGLSWLMVRVGPAWFLFDGWTGLAVKRGLTFREWHEQAALVYPGNGRWGLAPAREGAHPYSTQLRCWLRWELTRMQPWSRARAMRLRACNETTQPLSIDALAEKLGWERDRLVTVELGGGSDSDLYTLLDYWNS